MIAQNKLALFDLSYPYPEKMSVSNFLCAGY
jgi:hypothetical protein